MTLIDKSGERQACDRCHRVNVKFKRGKTACDECRAAAWAEEVQYRRDANLRDGFNFYKLPAARIWEDQELA